MTKPKIFLLSLGCSKNTVDSERLAAQAEAAGLTFTDTADEADTILINTCGFIEDAKEESITEILAAIEKKEDGTIRNVYVMGCLPELYGKELEAELPEIDAFFGTRELPRILESLGASYRVELHDQRSLLSPPHTSWLKIAEGCSRQCSFCTIPKIRGPYQSQPVDQLLREAHLLKEKGVRELNLIAQDISIYGIDLYGRPMLNDLLQRLSDMGFDWLRLLYAYPVGFPLEVIDTMRERENVCNYLDIPLQHANDRILRSMQRGITSEGTLKLIENIRQRNPDIRLRTTMITGYPGETREEFEELMEFVAATGFDRLGCFPYCHEEQSPAARLHDNVPAEVKQERAVELMELQEKISEKKNALLEGTRQVVLIDQVEGDMAFARTAYDAPEVDNECLLNSGGLQLHPGMFCHARIDNSTPYELGGEIIAIIS